MKERIEPGLFNELQSYGVDVGNWNECFHCGNCTAICPLTEQGVLFPRKEIRWLQIGLKKELVSSIEPWMCYYCGDCSKRCPRDANPGELMMALRRWLTSMYDWTGISKLIYKSKAFELGAIFFLALTVGYLFFLATPSIGDIIDNPDKYTDQVSHGVLINTVAPVDTMHIGDLVMAGLLALLLISNVFSMWYKVILSKKGLKVPFSAYFTSIFTLVWSFMTQDRFKKCDDDSRSYWYIHLFLMLSYIMLFTMIVFFLDTFFQTDKVHGWWHPQRLLGYISTIGLLTGIIFFTIKRRQKNREGSKYTHYTDSTFLVLLFLTTVTGILLHFFRIWGMPAAVWFTYLIHLMVLVPMLVIEVPFSKWSHLAYRPMAVYFASVIKKAKKEQEQ